MMSDKIDYSSVETGHGSVVVDRVGTILVDKACVNEYCLKKHRCLRYKAVEREFDQGFLQKGECDFIQASDFIDELTKKLWKL